MTPTEIQSANTTLATQSPQDIIRWAVARSNGRALVSTNFRPYEAVILHMAVQV